MAGDTEEQASSSSNISQENNDILEGNLPSFGVHILKGSHDLSDIDAAIARVAEAIQGQDIYNFWHKVAQIAGRNLRLEYSSTLQVIILEEPLTAQNLSAIIAAITDLYTRCWLIQQKRFSHLMDYTQTRDSRFVKEASLRIGVMSHNSPAIIDFLVSAGGIAGGAATLALALKVAIDAIAQTPLRFEATKIKNQREIQNQQIQGKQSQLDQQIAAQKAETEDKGKQQEQQLEAERKLFELERQRMLLEIEKQKFEVEAEKERAKLVRERLEFERNRVIIVQEIAVTMVGQLLSNEDRQDAGRTEMLVHSLIPSLLQLAATDSIVTIVPTEPPKEEDKGSAEDK